jgi:L-malate glycosyltransferase
VKIKLLYVIDALERGGTEKQLVLLADQLPRDLYDPCIAVLRKTAFQASLGLKTRVVDLGRDGAPLLRDLRVVSRLARLIEDEQFDIVQTHFVDSSIYGALAVRLCHKRPVLVGTRRNLYYWIGDSPWSFRLYRYASRWADHILINSHSLLEKCRELERIPARKITLIQNGVEVEKFHRLSSAEARSRLGLNGERPVVGVVGNFRPVKGLHCFLEAAGRLARELPSCTFVMVGDGPQREELRAHAGELGILDRIRFVTDRTETHELIPAFDIAVQPSLSESFSNVLVEYMAAGRPIVATRVGDAEHVIEDRSEGLLVPPGRSDRLVEAIRELSGDLELASVLGRRAAEKVEARWAFPQILEAYHRFYSGVVA